jgi:hypothetical protein
VRDVRGEPSHLLERFLEAAQCLVENGRQPSHLVFGIVDRKALAEAFGGDRARVLRYPLDGRQRATGEDVSAESRNGDGDRQAERKNERQLPYLLARRLFRTGDLNDDVRVADGAPPHLELLPTGQDAHRRGLGRDRNNPFAADRLALGHGPTERLAVTEQQFRAVRTPDLHPRQALLRIELFQLVQHEVAVRRLIQAGDDPEQIVAQLLVERVGYAAADEGVDGKGVNAEHHDHRADVPDGQPDAHAVRSPPGGSAIAANAGGHGSPSRSRNPTPRTV